MPNNNEKEAMTYDTRGANAIQNVLSYGGDQHRRRRRYLDSCVFPPCRGLSITSTGPIDAAVGENHNYTINLLSAPELSRPAPGMNLGFSSIFRIQR